MNYTVTLLGVEVGFWPALPLLLLLILGGLLVLLGVIGGVHTQGVLKSWSGMGESHLLSRFRIFLPQLCFFFGVAGALCALADIKRTYVVVSDQYATNTLYIDIDNSSSMYNFGDNGRSFPIHCSGHYTSQETKYNLKYDYPRIFNACRTLNNIVDATEAYAKKKGDSQQDKIGLLRFGLYSFVEIYGTTDYERVRKRVRELNWRDPRTGVYTEIHLALFDLFQVALQRNFRGEKGMTALDEADRLTLARSLYPEGQNVRYHVPRQLREKFVAMRADLRDTAFIFVTDAQEGQFAGRLDKEPYSLVKMMQLAEFLELPVYVISIHADHEVVRKLAEKTGFGPLQGDGRGAFYLIKGEKNFKDIDVIVSNILSKRFRVVSTTSHLKRIPYTAHFSFIAVCFVMAGLISSLSPFGREITKGERT
ncbi:MAG: hypothetical protein Q8R25_04230 [bacterium]|nr:hypothetical protein [bacterium]